MGTTKARFIAGICNWFDSVTHERTLVAAAVQMKDDFLGKAIDTTKNWTALDTSAAGDTTPVLVADAPGGVVSLPLDNTNEVQLSGLTGGDQRNYSLDRAPVFECRARFTVLPTGSVVAAFGFCGDHNAAVDTVAESVWFRADGSGALTVENDDTSHETTKVATGVTVVANEWFTLRIELQDPADVKFYINGNRVASSTTFNMNAVPTLVMQPVVRIGKEAGATTVGTIQLDYVAAWQKRTA